MANSSFREFAILISEMTIQVWHTIRHASVEIRRISGLSIKVTRERRRAGGFPQAEPLSLIKSLCIYSSKQWSKQQNKNSEADKELMRLSAYHLRSLCRYKSIHVTHYATHSTKPVRWSAVLILNVRHGCCKESSTLRKRVCLAFLFSPIASHRREVLSEVEAAVLILLSLSSCCRYASIDPNGERICVLIPVFLLRMSPSPKSWRWRRRLYENHKYSPTMSEFLLRYA